MTSEEMKQAYSMSDIVRRYGFVPNRRGFISCPFHQGDRTPSLKVYDRDFHCHSCGANGDIFTFVQMMEDVDFKGAYQRLGGTYGEPTFSSRLSLYRSKKTARNALERKGTHGRTEEAKLHAHKYLPGLHGALRAFVGCLDGLL